MIHWEVATLKDVPEYDLLNTDFTEHTLYKYIIF